VVGGFSFGSMVGLTVGAEEDRVVALFGLGLPVELDDRYDYTGMFFSNFPKGMGEFSKRAKEVGRHEIFWNVDQFRSPVSGALPPWIS